jgi:hypothetical protein
MMRINPLESLPIETRMAMLRNYREDCVQMKNIQDDCPHDEGFEESGKTISGKAECKKCGIQCEHWEYEDGVCLDCGERDERDYDREEDDDR